MLWKDVEKRFGKKLANKMKKCPYMRGITVRITKQGFDYPESDIQVAYKWAKGLPISDWEID